MPPDWTSATSHSKATEHGVGMPAHAGIVGDGPRGKDLPPRQNNEIHFVSGDRRCEFIDLAPVSFAGGVGKHAPVGVVS